MPKILVVEDDKLFKIQIESMLDELGYKKLAFALTYDEALNYLTFNHVDILIVDIKLAGRKTGIDLAEKVKNWAVPILFITS